MRPLPAHLLALLLALPGAAPASAQGTATLLNRTRQVWRVQADPMAAPRIQVWLTVTPAQGSPATAVDVPGTGTVAVDLAPGASLAISHREPPGREVQRLFELRTEPGPDHPGPRAVEGSLLLRTARTRVFWGPERTSLAGLLYADGQAQRFQCAAQADGTLALELAPEPEAGTCLISCRPATWTPAWRWPRLPAPAGAAG